MKADQIIAMLIRAGMDTLFRHLPAWLARRKGAGTASPPDPALERDLRQKMRMTRKIMRWLR